MSFYKLIPFKQEGNLTDVFEVPPGIKLIKAPSLWKEGYKGKNIVVAVIDTGCQASHPDLIGQVIDGYNFTSDYNGTPANYNDNNGHGTHVSGTIAAAKNSFGVSGAAPGAKILALKALDANGEGTDKNIAAAIKYAVNWTGPAGEKVRVISMSLGGPEDNPSIHAAIKHAVRKNILVVCAAGNEGDGSASIDEYSYPGAYPEVVEVGSVNLLQQISSFSNSNSEVDLVAPGEQILSTYPVNSYSVLSGTSMAAPHVSGAAALIIEKYETIWKRMITEPEIFNLLMQHTVTLGNPRKEEGNGIIKLNTPKKQKLRSLLQYLIKQTSSK
ncbi:S8 family peptidase [Peribacillus sp. B-H-3]|uniref:S8 family peptidase n=1 Tax=Peribacillus sp. B-H-3 TaxID=3400420 RepID=UPI003B024F15